MRGAGCTTSRCDTSLDRVRQVYDNAFGIQMVISSKTRLLTDEMEALESGRLDRLNKEKQQAIDKCVELCKEIQTLVIQYEDMYNEIKDETRRLGNIRDGDPGITMKTFLNHSINGLSRVKSILFYKYDVRPKELGFM
jgi:hypothetical protein